MDKFSSFAEERLVGDKVSVSDILNKEITVLSYKIMKSKIEDDNYAQIQIEKIEINGEKKVVFTSSKVLKDQLETYKDHIPFIATIIKTRKYFSFS